MEMISTKRQILRRSAMPFREFNVGGISAAFRPRCLYLLQEEQKMWLETFPEVHAVCRENRSAGP
jgi:hypothetical protein